MIIRRARPADALAIAAIHVASWKSAYQGIMPEDHIEKITVQQRYDFWKKEITAGGDVFVSLDAEDKIQGWISFGHDRDAPDSTDTTEIYAIYIHPGSVRKGIGASLMREVVATLLVRKNTNLTVWVLEDNHNARNFYNKQGFSSIPIKKTIIERGGVALVELKLQLSIADPDIQR